jgi:hypothetical protein
MDYFAGLDVSVKETSVCIVDDAGKIVREARVAREPEALLQTDEQALSLQASWIEAGPLSQWLLSALAEAGLPVICVETRHMRAVLKAQINKTDRKDARGIAQMMRAGLYRPVHVRLGAPNCAGNCAVWQDNRIFGRARPLRSLKTRIPAGRRPGSSHTQSRAAFAALKSP